MIQGVDYAGIDRDEPPVVEKTGMSFAYVRGAYTFNGKSRADSVMQRDRDLWGKHGVPFGAYAILGWHGDSPKAQMQTLMEAYGDRRPGELPPALDLEANSAESLRMKPQEILDHALEAYDALVARYGIVAIYTSCRVWREVFGNLPASRLGYGPLWLKVGYHYKAKNPPHPETCPSSISDLPPPWRQSDSAGAWIVQYQGDAVDVDGFSWTVDLNGWIVKRDSAPGLYVRKLLARHGFGDLRSFQRAGNLAVDGVIGPKTFAALTYFA